MIGKFLANKSSFDLEITKTKWKNRKKKKQATTITPGVATYPFAGERGEAHGCVFQRRKMRVVTTNVYLWKTSEKNRRKPAMKNIPDSGVVFTFEEGRQKWGSCSYVPSIEEEIRPT
ncbi:hypothetical protein HKD37_06G016526 [Glycine soja]